MNSYKSLLLIFILFNNFSWSFWHRFMKKYLKKDEQIYKQEENVKPKLLMCAYPIENSIITLFNNVIIKQVTNGSLFPLTLNLYGFDITHLWEGAFSFCAGEHIYGKIANFLHSSGAEIYHRNVLYTITSDLEKYHALVREILLPAPEFVILHHLRHLNLAYNRINHLPTKLFHNVRSLIHLDLRGNFLSHLPEGVFDGLKKLEILDLSENYLHFISSRDFMSFENLKTLNLARNKIRNIEPFTLQPMRNLIEIDLSENVISKINDHDLKCYSDNMKILNLGDNCIRTIESSAFNSYFEGTKVELFGNLINEDNCYILPSDIECDHQALTTLEKCANGIKDLLDIIR